MPQKSSIAVTTDQGSSMVGRTGPADLFAPSRCEPFWRQWVCRTCGEVRFVEGAGLAPPLRACAWCGKEGSDWMSLEVDFKDKPLNQCHPAAPPKIAPVKVPAGAFPRGPCKALLIGLNYYNQGADLELQGAIRDVQTMRQFLTFQGWPADEAHMRAVLDDRSGPLPTRQVILDALRWLVAGADAGSNLFLQFSGQGVPEEGCFLTADCDVVLEDELWDIVAAPLPRGARLTCLFDVFRPMTLLRLPKYYSIEQSKLHSHLLHPWERKLQFPADIVTIYAGPTLKPFEEGRDSRVTGAVFHAFIAMMIELGPQCTYAALLGGMERSLWKRRLAGLTMRLGCLEPRELDPLGLVTFYADHSALRKLDAAQVMVLLDLIPDLPSEHPDPEGPDAAKPACGHPECVSRQCCRIYQKYDAVRTPQKTLQSVPVL